MYNKMYTKIIIMSYREKENIVNIFSGLLITLIYGWYVYQQFLIGSINLTTDYKTWGAVFLYFIVISIVVRIIILIIFHIINAIATREDKIPIEDERDKMIKLRATRNSYYIFSGGFVMSIMALALGMPVYWLFIAFIVVGLLAEIIDNGSQIYYYRKGV